MRQLLLATLACTSMAPGLVADDFIRPPSKPKLTVPKPDQAIKQPASPVVTQAPAPVSVPPQSTETVQPAPATPFTGDNTSASTNSPAPSRTLELDAPRIPEDVVRNQPPKNQQPEGSRSRIPASFASRPADAPVPAQVTSATKPSSPQLNWQPRGSTPRTTPTGSQATVSTDSPSTVFGPASPAPQSVRSNEVRLVPESTAEPVLVDEERLARQQLAERISKQLTSDPATGGLSTIPLEPGTGWQAIGEELKVHVAKCEELLSRRAYLSAIEEASQGTLRLCRALDLRENRPLSEPAWMQAQQSFREAQDFTRIERLANDSQLLTQIIQSHQTEALRGANVSELTPLAAAQHYRAHAESCLVAAAQGHPWFCELYYCMGRAMQAQSETNKRNSEQLMLQALSYYRAAAAIDPANATNSNQLAYVLLRLDRPTEAMSQLQQTVTLPGCPLEAWQNLVQASTRLGDKTTEKWAVDQYMTLKMQGAEPSGPANTLLQVSPEQFMAMSPRTVGPNLPVGASMQMQPTPNQVAPIAPGAPAPVSSGGERTANSSIFGIFR